MEEKTATMQEIEPFKPNPPSKEFTEMPVIEVNDEHVEGKVRRLQKMKTSFELPSGTVALPLQNDAHRFIFVHIAHQSHRPISIYPAIRILGAFSTEDEVKDWIKQYYGTDQSCSSWLTVSHQLLVLCESTSKQLNQKYFQDHMKTLLSFHENLQNKSQTDFDENVENRKIGKTGCSLYAKDNKLKQKHNQTELKQFKNKIKNLPSTTQLSQSVRVNGQNFAVIIILRDLRQLVLEKKTVAEPGIAILDVFSELDDALHYAKYTASKHYSTCSIDVVDMYQWIFPENVDTDAIPEMYGNEQLNDIMVGRKDTNANVAKYEEYCKEHNLNPDVTSVDVQEEELQHLSL